MLCTVGCQDKKGFSIGCTCYEDIRTIDNIVYTTFREACYKLSLLEDDKEYTDASKEANQWASMNYVRRLFVILLSSNCWSYFNGEIYLWKNLSVAIRSKGEIVINVASNRHDCLFKVLTALTDQGDFNMNDKKTIPQS